MKARTALPALIKLPPPSCHLPRGRAASMLLSVAVVTLAFSSMARAQAPAVPGWWESRGVVKEGVSPMDYAPANQGQLKNFARAARDEMLAKGCVTEGDAIDAMVDGWLGNITQARDYAPVNLGQLKAVAKPFYDRLMSLGQLPAGVYPWSAPARPASDYAMANLGQLKAVFAFGIALADTDEDGINDSWEMNHFGILTRDPLLDADGDGVSDNDEWLAGTDPRDWRSRPGSAAEDALMLSIYTPMVR